MNGQCRIKVVRSPWHISNADSLTIYQILVERRGEGGGGGGEVGPHNLRFSRARGTPLCHCTRT